MLVWACVLFELVVIWTCGLSEPVACLNLWAASRVRSALVQTWESNVSRGLTHQRTCGERSQQFQGQIEKKKVPFRYMYTHTHTHTNIRTFVFLFCFVFKSERSQIQKYITLPNMLLYPFSFSVNRFSSCVNVYFLGNNIFVDVCSLNICILWGSVFSRDSGIRDWLEAVPHL